MISILSTLLFVWQGWLGSADALLDALWFSSVYSRINAIKDIVVANSKDYEDYMRPDNLTTLRKKGVSRTELMTNANKFVLNYAASLKTYIDIHLRLLKKYTTADKQAEFQKLCSEFYDTTVEYRFWMNMRNYVVHCELPYNGISESEARGIEIICTKDHLLEFGNWKHSKKDILAMGSRIDISSMVFEMSAMIMALYQHFILSFGQVIIDTLSTYQTFCKEHKVEQPVFLFSKEKMTRDNAKTFVNTSDPRVPPVNDIFNAYRELESNPLANIVNKQSE